MRASASIGLDLSPLVLQATLRRITERLAAELAEPSDTAPDWSESDWTVARAVAALHGVSPLLSRQLRWTGPDTWVEFLERQRIHTRNRQLRIENLVRRLGERAREAGISMVPLKGVELHRMGIYSCGDRPMADVDILVRPADAENTKILLESMDFYEARVTWKERLFMPIHGHVPAHIGEHSDNDIKVELHEKISEKLPLRLTDVSVHVFPARATAGMNAYPSQSALMIHLLLHAAGSMAYQALRLVHVHDMALLARRMTSADWEDVLQADMNGQRLWWAYPPLRLVSRYYPSHVPASILARLERECPRLLAAVSRRKTLCDVSFSHLWLDAFPGIEWSRSPSDMLRYVGGRIWPSASHLASRKASVKLDMWTSADRWQTLPQIRRMLRWVLSKQARAPTMYVVKAAFAHAGNDARAIAEEYRPTPAD